MNAGCLSRQMRAETTCRTQHFDHLEYLDMSFMHSFLPFEYSDNINFTLNSLHSLCFSQQMRAQTTCQVPDSIFWPSKKFSYIVFLPSSDKIKSTIHFTWMNFTRGVPRSRCGRRLPAKRQTQNFNHLKILSYIVIYHLCSGKINSTIHFPEWTALDVSRSICERRLPAKRQTRHGNSEIGDLTKSFNSWEICEFLLISCCCFKFHM